MTTNAQHYKRNIKIHEAKANKAKHAAKQVSESQERLNRIKKLQTKRQKVVDANSVLTSILSKLSRLSYNYQNPSHLSIGNGIYVSGTKIKEKLDKFNQLQLDIKITVNRINAFLRQGEIKKPIKISLSYLNFDETKLEEDLGTLYVEAQSIEENTISSRNPENLFNAADKLIKLATSAKSTLEILVKATYSANTALKNFQRCESYLKDLRAEAKTAEQNLQKNIDDLNRFLAAVSPDKRPQYKALNSQPEQQSVITEHFLPAGGTHPAVAKIPEKENTPEAVINRQGGWATLQFSPLSSKGYEHRLLNAAFLEEDGNTSTEDLSLYSSSSSYASNSRDHKPDTITRTRNKLSSHHSSLWSNTAESCNTTIEPVRHHNPR